MKKFLKAGFIFSFLIVFITVIAATQKTISASTGDLYVITGAGSTFSATRNGVPLSGATDRPIISVISAIGFGIQPGDTIQFGDGVNTLDIGMEVLHIDYDFVTITGSLTSSNAWTTISVYADMIFAANIYNTGTGSAIITFGEKTLTVSNAFAITASGAAIRRSGSGAILINGGFFFSHGTQISDVLYNIDLNGVSGATVIAWSGSPGDTYISGSATALTAFPANNATNDAAHWRTVSDVHGIIYHGGFFPVYGITVQKDNPASAHFDFYIPSNSVYNGSPQGIGGVTAAANVIGLGAITVLYDGSAAIPTNAGTYEISVNVAEDLNFNAAAGVVLGNFTIAPRDLSDVSVTASFPPVTFDGTAQTPMPSAVMFDGAETGSFTLGAYTDNVNAGTASVAIHGTDNFTGTANVNFTINPLGLTLAADNQIILVGEPEPLYTFSVNGLVGGDTAAVIDFPPSIGVTGFDNTVAGVFPIVISGGTTSNANYVIAVWENGILTISDKAAVTQAHLYFDIPANAVYNGNPQGIGGVSAAMNVTGLGAITVLYNGSATLPTNAGFYEISVNISEGANFSAVTGLVLGNFSIAPKNLSDVTVTAVFPSVTFNGAAQAPMPMHVAFDGAYTASFTLGAYSDNVNAGIASVEINGTGNFIGTATVNFTIDPKNLTLVADNQSIRVGESEPVYTFTVIGLVSGDTAAVITTPPTVGVSGFDSGIAGSFPIIISGGAASNTNYTISAWENGILSVTEKDVVIITATVADRLYTGFPYAGLSNIHSGAFSGALELLFEGTGDTVFAASSEPPVNVGTYRVTISVPADNAEFAGSAVFYFSITAPVPHVPPPPPLPSTPSYDGAAPVLTVPARTPAVTEITVENISLSETETVTETENRFFIQIGSNQIIDLTGSTIEMDVAPIIRDGRTLLPLRFIAQIFGAEIEWNEASREVTLTLDGRTLILPIGTVTPELSALGMDVPPIIVDGRTMVPVRFISEFFNADVHWDEAGHSLEIIIAYVNNL